ncbi:MAG: BON domain-containing protein [Methylophilaceae bacterium]|jgi:osmotically-inducible protein OsmY|nr:BON domain-containing protein [Methyloradius sp.]
MRLTIKLVSKLVLATAIATQLSACLPVIVGGAAVGGSMATDRRSSGTYIDDQTIELKVSKKIIDNIGEANIHLNATSYNRNLLLTGEVGSEEYKAKAETVAKTLENVRSITNELTVDENSKLTERNNDTYITSKVKTRLINADGKLANYTKVVTEAGVVYLMGLVTKQEAAQAVEIASSTSGVLKVVKVFEYIDEK